MSTSTSNNPNTNQKSSTVRSSRRRRNPRQSNIPSDTVHLSINQDEQTRSEVLINSSNTSYEIPVEMPSRHEETSSVHQPSSEPREESRIKKPTRNEDSRKSSIQVERLNTLTSSQGSYQNDEENVHLPEEFLLKNAPNRNYNEDHNLDNVTCPFKTEYKDYDEYHDAFELKLQRSDFAASWYHNIQKISKSKTQDTIKVKLSTEYALAQLGLEQKWVILKAVHKNDSYSLEEKLISGRRPCIITKTLPFKIENLNKPASFTYLCAIGKYKQLDIVVNCLENLMVPPVSQEQWIVETPETPEEEKRKLKCHEYYLIVMDPIVANIREYNAVSKCKDSPLIRQIITNNLAENIQDNNRPLIDESEFFTPEGFARRKKLDAFQENIVRAVEKTDLGIKLVHGPPGVGKTTTLIRITQNQVMQIQKNQEIMPQENGQKDKVMINTASKASASQIASELLNSAEGWKKDSPKLLLFFHADQINERLLSCNFYHQREIRLLETQNKPKKWTLTLRLERKQIKEKIKQMMKERRNRQAIKQEREKIHKIQEQIVKINKEMSNRRQDLDKIDAQLFQDSSIIICTLNAAGNKKITKFCRNRIHCLLIDDANQATEVSTLIPFATLVEKVVLVGNKYQLLPTVKTNLFAYKHSLFYRLTKNNRYFLLNNQYRMNPEIMQFPNKSFYWGNMKNKLNPLVPACLAEMQEKSILYDVDYGTEEVQQSHFINKAEAQCIMTVIPVLTNCSKQLTIGVISVYKQQVELLESQIYCLKLPEKLRKNIRVGTIEAFQGLQMDVIIFSTVRTSYEEAISTLNDSRRLNFASTRARSAFFVFGSFNVLDKLAAWQDFVMYHAKRESLHPITEGKSKTFFSS